MTVSCTCEPEYMKKIMDHANAQRQVIIGLKAEEEHNGVCDAIADHFSFHADPGARTRGRHDEQRRQHEQPVRLDSHHAMKMLQRQHHQMNPLASKSRPDDLISSLDININGYKCD